MNRGKKLLVGICVVTVIAVGGKLAWDWAYPSASYRFRMTIDVETPQGLRTGSGVFEVWAREMMKLTPESRARDWGVRGEAVAIDLPDGSIFALMKTQNSFRKDLALMSMAALDPMFKNDVVESAGRIESRGTGVTGEVLRADWPLMARFSDIDDPKTINRVDSKSVGVKRITVETTDDKVTLGLRARSAWLYDLNFTQASWILLPDEARSLIIHLRSNIGENL